MDSEVTSESKTMEVATDHIGDAIRSTPDVYPSSESEASTQDNTVSTDVIASIALEQDILLPNIAAEPSDLLAQPPNLEALESVQNNVSYSTEYSGQSENAAQLAERRNSSSHYGTFNVDQKEPNITDSSVSYDLDSESKTESLSWPSDEHSASSKSNVIIVVRQPTERTELFSKAELDHLCYDPYEQIRLRPDGGHWWKIIASTVICPACGFISLFYAYKSRRRYRDGSLDSAQQMLRHSDFCFRFAIVCGILCCVFAFMFFVVHDMKK